MSPETLTLFSDPSELASAVQVNRPGPAPREQETSVMAALLNSVRSGSQRARALHRLAHVATDHGLTDDELAFVLPHPRPHVAGTRRKELQDLGLVEPVPGERRPTRLGCLAQAYRATPLGIAVNAEVKR